MKLVANKYEVKDVVKILREWTGLTQTDFAKEADKKGLAWTSDIEGGRNKVFFNDILKIAKKHNIKIIFEKDDK